MHIRISTRGDRKNVPGIPGACATHNFTYLARGPCITLIDYKLYYKSFSSAVSNVKVNPYEECIKQHHMVVCDFTTHIPHVKKCKFSPHIPTWKLMDPVTARQFQSASKLKTTITSAGASVDTANHVDSSWSKLKGAARCCHQRLQSFQEPPVKNWNFGGGGGGGKEGFMVGPWGASVSRNGLCMSSKVRTLMHRVVCCSMISAVRILVWEFMCIRALSFADCSSFRCWKRFPMSSALVCHGGYSILMTLYEAQTPLSVSPSSRRCGRLEWKVKGFLSTWRTSSWFLMLTKMS